MGYLDDAVLVLSGGVVWFSFVYLPDILSKRQNNKFKIEQEKTKQLEAIRDTEAAKLETKRLEGRQYDGYPE